MTRKPITANRTWLGFDLDALEAEIGGNTFEGTTDQIAAFHRFLDAPRFMAFPGGAERDVQDLVNAYLDGAWHPFNASRCRAVGSREEGRGIFRDILKGRLIYPVWPASGENTRAATDQT